MARMNYWSAFRLGSQATLACLALCVFGAERVLAQDAAPAAEASAWVVPSDEEIRDLLAERMADNGVGVVVGVVEPSGHRLISYGRSGAANGRPLDGDTIFQIGSVTKVFTTLLLADMALRGEVKLDDPAADYLPEGVPMPRNGREILLSDLATHMSGLPSMPTNYDLAGEPSPYEAYSVDDLNAFLGSYTPPREPGAEYEYSNLAVALLGRLLAARAGGDYETVLTERILEPLGLASTAITLDAEQAERLAPGHDRNLDPVDTWEMKSLQGSGSLRSSVNDLMSVLDAYLGYRDTPLADAMAHQLAAVRQPAGGTTQLLGWSERTFEGATVIGHDGGKEGYRSAVLFNPNTRVGVVVLSNARTDDTPIFLAVHLLTGRPLPPASAAPSRPEGVASSEQLEAAAGHYATEDGERLVVARRDDHLLLDRVGGGVMTFFPAGGATFQSNTSGEALVFQIGSNGRVTGLEIRQGSRTTPATRVD